MYYFSSVGWQYRAIVCAHETIRLQRLAESLALSKAQNISQLKNKRVDTEPRIIRVMLTCERS
jgi:hypothetical protein